MSNDEISLKKICLVNIEELLNELNTEKEAVLKTQDPDNYSPDALGLIEGIETAIDLIIERAAEFEENIKA